METGREVRQLLARLTQILEAGGSSRDGYHESFLRSKRMMLCAGIETSRRSCAITGATGFDQATDRSRMRKIVFEKLIW